VLPRSRPTDEQDQVAPPEATQAQPVPNLLNSCQKLTPQPFQRKPEGMLTLLPIQQFELRGIPMLTPTVVQTERASAQVETQGISLTAAHLDSILRAAYCNAASELLQLENIKSLRVVQSHCIRCAADGHQSKAAVQAVDSGWHSNSWRAARVSCCRPCSPGSRSTPIQCGRCSEAAAQ